MFDTTNTENGLEIMREVEQYKLHRMAMVSNGMWIWQGRQNPGAS
jgi:hypothetical protein